jgi:hypothetical protein
VAKINKISGTHPPAPLFAKQRGWSNTLYINKFPLYEVATLYTHLFLGVRDMLIS